MRILHEDESREPVRINVPVMGVDGKPMLLNDLGQGTYDVCVKIGPSYATRRSEAADSMLQFIQAVPQAASVAGDWWRATWIGPARMRSRSGSGACCHRR